MNCLMIPLPETMFTDFQPSSGLKNEVELKFNSHELKFQITNQENGEDKTLGFSLEKRGAKDLARTIFSYFGDNFYEKYHRLREDIRRKEKIPQFYCVWMVKFQGDNKWYQWQDGNSHLDHTRINNFEVAVRQYIPYSHTKESIQ